ncbi:MAG: OmpH family outer membrane protein [Gammaproteobacteria bacterium]|nr:OmpH family outer membrane protein [Gammaproteobacteria bacterium]NIR96257.1 OmpH family outer membrane protein [Gammaproteobacteria bacterium]NIW44468.1 OmpH family outer membrane protein [Gammaproteobacteria bacterium]NIX55594.1 OmpH family outer membrane protein [candidate division Zixibacteria bacterium]
MKQFFVLFVVCLSLVAAPAMAQAQKIAYVDLQKALNLSSAGKEAKEKIKAKVQEYDADVQQRQEELKKLKDDLEKQAMLLSEDARNAKERDYQQKVKEYQRFTKDIQETLQQMDADFTRKILEDLLKVAQDFGKSEGYSMILEKTESSIVYADESIDITDDVIKEFDTQGQ